MLFSKIGAMIAVLVNLQESGIHSKSSHLNRRKNMQNSFFSVPCINCIFQRYPLILLIFLLLIFALLLCRPLCHQDLWRIKMCLSETSSYIELRMHWLVIGGGVAPSTSFSTWLLISLWHVHKQTYALQRDAALCQHHLWTQTSLKCAHNLI